MTMTREEADMVVKEAIAQGWADKDTSNIAVDTMMGEGRVDLIDFGTPPGVPGPGGNSGCIVELGFPGMWSTSRYWVASTDDWRKLKAKVDEMKEIVKQAAERGWGLNPRPLKVGKLGMMVEIIPPGTASYYPRRVGGMRTWRKLCREYDEMITIDESKELRP